VLPSAPSLIFDQAAARSRGFEEEFTDPLEEKDGPVGGFRHEFYLCFSACAFMAGRQCSRAGTIQTQNTNAQPLLAAGCKGTYPIDRRQWPTPGVGATNGDILPAEQTTPMTVFLTTRVSAG